MIVSSEETKLDDYVMEIPNKKGVEREKEEKKKEHVKETSWKPKITIVHRRKPKSNEQSQSKAKRRTGKKKSEAQDLIDQIINGEFR